MALGDGGVAWSTRDLSTTYTFNGDPRRVQAGVGGYTYITPTVVGPNSIPFTTPGFVTFDQLVIPQTVTPGGIARLSPGQLYQLLNEHRFIPMDNSEFCLFCYALDQFRVIRDHIFVISEE